MLTAKILVVLLNEVRMGLGRVASAIAALAVLVAILVAMLLAAVTFVHRNSAVLDAEAPPGALELPWVGNEPAFRVDHVD